MPHTIKNQSRGFVIAGLCGGSGKSVLSVGLTAALTEQGIKVAPFKKGPDYIDAGWLQLAAHRPCHNLDPYLMTAKTIRHSFQENSEGSDIALVEGNRGLFDGVNAAGSYSTAELAAILGLPVTLVVDCTKTTRTVAALLLGCQQMGSEIKITGVILNRIGSARHQRIIRQAIEEYTDITVLGAMPRQRHDIFPQRHIGITPCPEFDGADTALVTLAQTIRDSIDLEKVIELSAPIVPPPPTELHAQWQNPTGDTVRIGVIKDAAFQFYYPENLRALELCGAQLLEVNALSAQELPDLDGLYIGGGFPENSVQALSKNTTFRTSLKQRIEQGLPVYAECGGLLYLGRAMELEGGPYPLVDIFPFSFRMEKRPQAHGYTALTATATNPVYQEGTVIKGHEFRYSKVIDWQGANSDLAFTMQRGIGFADGGDGLVYKNVLALYTHIHALATPEWAPRFIDLVKKNKTATTGG
ncbi:MAG: hydrogenobyrinic acid a,c-diamide synthase (glutamine-hydrolyzing) [Proteobacteria bacterium]|nr:hydrogenobyrinic acid a,c-diamide synthase (glutamine-hydrolyzing) [Desulfobulbaceae bacterium]MBU4152004.1 hydrogenobyrinic acid a,c-diamide synthase (glutamine-hydrolyzing) [Pseudomonadota bacterium]MDP2105803.1 cobyrinate a,c-diamide synthase [Desulfobulbaceae bacterium]